MINNNLYTEINFVGERQLAGDDPYENILQRTPEFKVVTTNIRYMALETPAHGNGRKGKR